MNSSLTKILSTTVLALAMASTAYAQATRTWVSGVGDDVNPCSRTAPCKTFAGAISKTAAGGEISALDNGGFGAVTIVKSITINGDGALASVLGSNTNGIIVNAAGTDVIILRNLSINGTGTGTNGIRFLNGKRLEVESCNIYGFTQSNIDVLLAAGGNLIVRNTTLSGGATGVHINSTTGTVNASLDNVSIRGAINGIDTLLGNTAVSNSNIAQNSGFGIYAEGGTIALTGNKITGNGIAVQAQTEATVFLSNNDIFQNQAGFGCGGGTLASDGSNRKGGNVGSVAVKCAPNATILMQ